MLPKYTLFKLYDPAAQHDTSTMDFRFNLVKRQIEKSKKINSRVKRQNWITSEHTKKFYHSL